MIKFLIGMVIFFGVHLIPNIGDKRAQYIDRVGEIAYMAIYALISLVGIALLSQGSRTAEFIPIWDVPTWTRHVAMPVMLVAIYFFVSIFVPNNAKRKLRHPMLFAISLWAVAHLMTNGDLVSIILFGSFAVFCLFKIVSLNMRKTYEEQDKKPRLNDVITAVITLVVYVCAVYFHSNFAGVAIV